MRKITFNGKEYNFAVQSYWRHLYDYEVVAPNMPFNPNSHLCLHIMFFVILLRENEGTFNYSFDEFVDAMTNVSEVNAMTAAYNEDMSRILTLDKESDEASEDDKKKD